MSIKKNLRAELARSGMTQAELAQAIGVSRGTVSSWCNGWRIPRMDYIVKMAKVLGVHRNVLLNGG